MITEFADKPTAASVILADSILFVRANGNLNRIRLADLPSVYWNGSEAEFLALSEYDDGVIYLVD